MANETKRGGTKKGLLAGILLLLALAAVLWAVYSHNAPTVTEGSKQYTLTVTDPDSSPTVYTAATDAAYVGDALRELTETQDFSMEGADSEFGFFLTTVNGLTADFDTDGAYWALYLNGEYATLGMDQQPLTDGDDIRLSYEQ